MSVHHRITRDPRDLALRLAPDGHKGAVVALLHGLAELREGDLADLVDGAADVLRHRLDRDERGLLLMAAAQAAEPEDLEALAEAVVAGDGPPLPPLEDIRAEAADWTLFASKSQVRAHMAAMWAVLPYRERRAFLAAVGKL